MNIDNVPHESGENGESREHGNCHGEGNEDSKRRQSSRDSRGRPPSPWQRTVKRKTTGLLPLLGTITGILFLVFWFRATGGHHNLSTVLGLLQKAGKVWIGAAVFLELTIIFWEAVLYQALYRMLGYKVPLVRVYLISLFSTFFEHTMPLGNVASFITFVGAAKKEGLPAWTSSAANALYYVFDYGAFSAFVLYSLIRLPYIEYLAPGATLYSITRTSLVVMTGLVSVALAGFVALIMFPSAAAYISRKAVQTANLLLPLANHRPLDEEKTLAAVAEFTLKTRELPKNPKLLGLIVGSATAITVTDILILYCLFRAIGNSIAIASLTWGFTTGTVMSLLTFIPNGIGVYMVSLWTVFTNLGVDSASSGAASLLYRLITYWLPALAGLLSFYLLGTGKGKTRKDKLKRLQ